MKSKLYELLRNYIDKKIHKRYHDRKGHHDRKCVYCNTWISEVGGCTELIDDPDDPMFELMTCAKCGHTSRWDCRGMLPVWDKSTENK